MQIYSFLINLDILFHLIYYKFFLKMSQIVYVPQCSSTNDEILSYLLGEEVVTLYTFAQMQGRGQYGNSWETLRNQNLAFSMVFPKSKITLSHTLFNFHTANILREFIAKKTQKKTWVKWPNDIIIAQKKVSGMLIEKKKIEQKEYLIVGIGLNILQENFDNLPKAGSILTQTGLRFNLTQWAEEMNEFFNEKLFAPISEEVLRGYNEHLFRKNKISVFEIQGMRQNGIVQYADTQGYLWVDLENEGVKKFYHKELELLY